MKKYFVVYKPFLVFLGKFLLTYLLLTLVYKSYLSQYDVQQFEVDSFTELVAEQTKDLMVLFNCDAGIKPNVKESAINIY